MQINRIPIFNEFDIWKKYDYTNNINNLSLPPVGYCIITTEIIETYNYLKEIYI